MSIEDRLTLLHEQVKGRLDDEVSDQVQEFIEVGEWGLALEVICDHMLEKGLVSSFAEWNDIFLLARDMEINLKPWDALRPGGR